ncbi:MAG: Hint domain-containing protein, partial [Pseudomonadota bacterium]
EGLRRVEDIAVGDEIWTSKDSASVVRWVGRRTAPCEGALAPIRFETGAIGNARPLLVSPEHRMVIRGPEPELLFGEGAVLTAAKHLLDLPGVTRVTGGVVTYHHFMFDDHAIVEAEGALSESFYAGPAAIDALEDGPRAELLSLFPELEAGQTAPLAMRSLTAVEAKALTGRLHAA